MKRFGGDLLPMCAACGNNDGEVLIGGTFYCEACVLDDTLTIR
jgi:hypothetical protein